MSFHQKYSTKKFKFTIVIPCFKEEARLPKYLKTLQILVKELDLNIIIVDDGSPEENFKLLEFHIKEYLSNSITLLHYPENKGKGYAISYGLSHSTSDYIGFLDADGSVPDYEVKSIFKYLDENSQLDMIIASRVMILGKHIDRKPLRHLSGRVFSTVLNLIFPMNVYDSQCGFKIFSRVKYEMIKDKITNMRWLWDTQLLILFYFNSYKIIEYPIDWHEEGDSKVKIFSDSFKMIFDLLIFKNKMREYGYKRI